MNKLVLSGYYGFNNAGDEAVLYSICRELRQQAPQAEITVLSADPSRTSRLYGVQAVNRWSLREIIGVVRRCDLLISGGGSLLQDVTGPQTIIYYLGVVTIARLLGKPVFFYAQGIGPVRGRLGRLLVRLVAGRVQYITVRDPESRADLADMGVRRPPVAVTADPVLGLEPSVADPGRGRDLLAAGGVTIPTGQPLLGVSLRQWPGFETSYVELAAVFDHLATRGWGIVLIPFYYPADVVVAREIAARMKLPAAVLDQNYMVEEMLSLTGAVDLVLGMRLHALIMAAALRIPLVGITYDPKIDRFLELVQQPNAGPPDRLHRDRLTSLLEQTWANRTQVQASLEQQMLVLGPLARSTARLAIGCVK